MSDFELLHPSIQHHVVNSLGWPRLRPLQEESIRPVLAGEHCMLLAPTAGGKTEAASFPVLSRIATENWQPLSVLYLAPLRALLNNLAPRLESYAAFVGRRVGLWHGDTTQTQRTRLISDPPDILLTTPESLEAMLISRRVNQHWLFPNLRAVVIDEVHAFAGADRGWHMLAVLERLSRLAGHDLQRIGLSATVGNPTELLDWFCGSNAGARRVINPPADVVAEPEVTLDHVGTLDNAATVISRLHRGDKRLVFVDSRRRAEELAVGLRQREVETFVSHGSLGQEERRRSEQAFAEASNCVIVATSTLELGIDVGDLDRVIQIDSPSTVAGFLQRIGRTGRRQGSSRNALFLATSEDALVTSAGLLRLWGQGYVEPATPPVLPAHLLAQQLLALSLQESDAGLGVADWMSWLGSPLVLGEDAADQAGVVLRHLLATDWLHSDAGVLSPGDVAERKVGGKHFMELMSAFVTDPIVSVRQGRTEIGQVPDIAITAAFASGHNQPTLMLAGRMWKIQNVDWKRRIAQVEPIELPGKIRFPGTGLPLSYELCQSAAAVLAGEDPEPVTRTERAEAGLADARAQHRGVRPGRSVLVPAERGRRWYTFAGLRANVELAARVSDLREQEGQSSNFYITIDEGVEREVLRGRAQSRTPEGELTKIVKEVSGALKLQDALPESLVNRILVERMRDRETVEKVAHGHIDRVA